MCTYMKVNGLVTYDRVNKALRRLPISDISISFIIISIISVKTIQCNVL